MEPTGPRCPESRGQPQQGGLEDDKAFYENLSPQKKPKSPKPQHAITIAVSSRALFRMEEEQKIYTEQGVEAYVKYQLEHEEEPFLPGAAFPFVKALESVNIQLRELFPDSEELFDIVLVTNNHAQVGVRLINSINHYRIAAATIFTPKKDVQVSEKQLRVAFDGDAVLFSDESEQIVKAHGLDKFFEHEKTYENKPLAQGPLKGFLEVLGKLQKKFYTKGLRLECPIRTYLVTARSAASSGARALKTLRSWGLETDEALFLAGAPKGPLLEKIRPHIFFDDQMFHVEGAKEMGTVAAHVPYGVAQKYKLSGQRKVAQDAK
ncbi:PREDICTED: cytosolic 5'-nucleotidase 1A isoform X2 [Thamnophis sirtalis]|uniref:Cytosolic 5'-nucleotidase 1A isoform X2 n=1 Tax=Thamnophis sirtalis TaxID=35019 RepID=A0A6I9XS11_9SAUR|nr:PREDICTED: cytosolic 5'-nucleotidase 1A isoform X2 [Thamnophis sirtalis]